MGSGQTAREWVLLASAILGLLGILTYISKHTMVKDQVQEIVERMEEMENTFNARIDKLEKSTELRVDAIEKKMHSDIDAAENRQSKAINSLEEKHL